MSQQLEGIGVEAQPRKLTQNAPAHGLAAIEVIPCERRELRLEKLPEVPELGRHGGIDCDGGLLLGLWLQRLGLQALHDALVF